MRALPWRKTSTTGIAGLERSEGHVQQTFRQSPGSARPSTVPADRPTGLLARIVKYQAPKDVPLGRRLLILPLLLVSLCSEWAGFRGWVWLIPTLAVPPVVLYVWLNHRRTTRTRACGMRSHRSRSSTATTNSVSDVAQYSGMTPARGVVQGCADD
jgi:hypothetical protein